MSSILLQIKNFIAQAQTDKAIALFLQESQGKEWHNEALSLSARYQAYKKKNLAGILRPDEANITIAQINHVLLELIDQYLNEKKESTKAPTNQKTKEPNNNTYHQTADKIYNIENIDKATFNGDKTPEPVTPQSSKPNHLWKYIIGLGVIMGILGSTAEFCNWIKPTPSSSTATSAPFDITVFVHDKTGQHIHYLQNKGEVVMNLKTDKRDERIGDKGEVNFKQIPGEFARTSVTLYLDKLDGDAYQVTHPDSQYVLTPDKAIYLETYNSNIARLKGMVRDKATGKRIEGAKVCIEDACVLTGANGRFLLPIPEALQKRSHTVTVQKEGYQEYIKNNPMTTADDLEVSLTAE